ncbi:hypothetical protein POTOM_005430 [Populus tomentosa]|uniref:Uncharacterized protein n=1 Tax=Populus tomentosa TaxID=118781 RepID=A0A8X8D6K1_POPTO|nr:hypothetical protein POTOM_005430 [Populus tomentosa]
MAELKGSLLPPKPASAINPRDLSYRLSASGPQPIQGVNVLGLKRRGQDLRSWIRVDSSGNSIPKLFVEKAMVVNLEQIRCIITADEVQLPDSLDSHVLQVLEVAMEAACTFLDSQVASYSRQVRVEAQLFGISQKKVACKHTRLAG